MLVTIGRSPDTDSFPKPSFNLNGRQRLPQQGRHWIASTRFCSAAAAVPSWRRCSAACTDGSTRAARLGLHGGSHDRHQAGVRRSRRRRSAAVPPPTRWARPVATSPQPESPRRSQWDCSCRIRVPHHRRARKVSACRLPLVTIDLSLDNDSWPKPSFNMSSGGSTRLVSMPTRPHRCIPLRAHTW